MKNNIGKVTRESDGFKVVLDRILPHDIYTVWDAITNPEKLKIWFTEVEMDFRQGGKITIWFQDENHTATYGQIVSIDPPNKFVYSWETELAVWELFEEDKNSCRIMLTYSKLADEYAVSAPAGFHSMLDQLELVLKGRTEPFPFGAGENTPEQLKLKEAYAEMIYKSYPELKRYEPIVIEKIYNAPVERVWAAITDKNEMKNWYFDLDEFKPEVGFEFQFFGTGHEGEKYLHLCKVTEAEPNKKLTYTWRYDKLEGDSSVSFELFPEGNRTKLRLTHRGLGSFPENNRDFARDSFQGGWNELINILLDNYLQKKQ
jgi:uncharacterized protein YndB with AHSA1/START domain